jgi:hypothetical protein
MMAGLAGLATPADAIKPRQIPCAASRSQAIHCAIERHGCQTLGRSAGAKPRSREAVRRKAQGLIAVLWPQHNLPCRRSRDHSRIGRRQLSTAVAFTAPQLQSRISTSLTE